MADTAEVVVGGSGEEVTDAEFVTFRRGPGVPVMRRTRVDSDDVVLVSGDFDDTLEDVVDSEDSEDFTVGTCGAREALKAPDDVTEDVTLSEGLDVVVCALDVDSEGDVADDNTEDVVVASEDVTDNVDFEDVTVTLVVDSGVPEDVDDTFDSEVFVEASGNSEDVVDSEVASGASEDTVDVDNTETSIVLDSGALPCLVTVGTDEVVTPAGSSEGFELSEDVVVDSEGSGDSDDGVDDSGDVVSS